MYRSALKIIEIPRTESELDDIRTQGMSEDSIHAYYKSIVEDLITEINLMFKLQGHSNIVGYQNHLVEQRTDAFGWKLYIQMELLTPLTKYIASNKNILKQETIIKLGIDICKALERCKQFNIIHRDIKPSNIFVSEFGDFKLGDFGIARITERTISNMSMKGTPSFMAPEVAKDLPYDASIDIYSLGMVMYRLLNNNRPPFYPPYPQQISYRDQQLAYQKRMHGDAIPLPANQDGPLGEIILKACSFDPQKRYRNPSDMRYDLECLLGMHDTEKNSDSDPEESIPPEPMNDPIPIDIPKDSTGTRSLFPGESTTITPTPPPDAPTPAEIPQKKKKSIILPICIGLLALSGIGFLGNALLHHSSDSSAVSTQQDPPEYVAYPMDHIDLSTLLVPEKPRIFRSHQHFKSGKLLDSKTYRLFYLDNWKKDYTLIHQISYDENDNYEIVNERLDFDYIDDNSAYDSKGTYYEYTDFLMSRYEENQESIQSIDFDKDNQWLRDTIISKENNSRTVIDFIYDENGDVAYYRKVVDGVEHTNPLRRYSTSHMRQLIHYTNSGELSSIRTDYQMDRDENGHFAYEDLNTSDNQQAILQGLINDPLAFELTPDDLNRSVECIYSINNGLDHAKLSLTGRTETQPDMYLVQATFQEKSGSPELALGDILLYDSVTHKTFCTNVDGTMYILQEMDDYDVTQDPDLHMTILTPRGELFQLPASIFFDQYSVASLRSRLNL